MQYESLKFGARMPRRARIAAQGDTSLFSKFNRTRIESSNTTMGLILEDNPEIGT